MKRRTLRSEAKKPKAQVSVSSQSQEMKFDFHSFKQTVMTAEGQVKRCGAAVGGERIGYNKNKLQQCMQTWKRLTYCCVKHLE